MEYDKNQNKEIAQTILSQIKALSPYALFSWGYKNAFLIKNGLAFQINTPKISNGWVNIVLDLGKDLYNIEFFNNRMRKLNTVKGVYCDQLVEIIDMNIEKEEYWRQIKR